MPCGQYGYGLCRTNRTRGLASRPVIGRLSYLQRQSKPAATRNYGSVGARANAIRRRVTKVKTPSRDQYGNVVRYGYGPLFGLRKGDLISREFSIPALSALAQTKSGR